MRFSIASLCRRYCVTRAGFYAWLRRELPATVEQDRVLSKEIRRLFTVHHARYGSPRLHHALTSAGWVISRRRVARLMREAGLRAKAVCGYRAKRNIHPATAWQRSSICSHGRMARPNRYQVRQVREVILRYRLADSLLPETDDV